MARRSHGFRPKIHKGADVYAGTKGGSRKTAPRRGKGHLAGVLPMDAAKPFQFGKENAKRRPKSSEPDNVGRKLRPAAHNKRQTGVAARARKQVKRLSDQVI